jgi:hypothetical protein
MGQLIDRVERWLTWVGRRDTKPVRPHRRIEKIRDADLQDRARRVAESSENVDSARRELMRQTLLARLSFRRRRLYGWPGRGDPGGGGAGVREPRKPRPSSGEGSAKPPAAGEA